MLSPAGRPAYPRFSPSRGFTFPDVGPGGGEIVLARHRDAMVAVADEVNLADFVEFDGGQVSAGGDQSVNALPPILDRPTEGGRRG